MQDKAIENALALVFGFLINLIQLIIEYVSIMLFPCSLHQESIYSSIYICVLLMWLHSNQFDVRLRVQSKHSSHCVLISIH